MKRLAIIAALVAGIASPAMAEKISDYTNRRCAEAKFNVLDNEEDKALAPFCLTAKSPGMKPGCLVDYEVNLWASGAADRESVTACSRYLADHEQAVQDFLRGGGK